MSSTSSPLHSDQSRSDSSSRSQSNSSSPSESSSRRSSLTSPTTALGGTASVRTGSTTVGTRGCTAADHANTTPGGTGGFGAPSTVDVLGSQKGTPISGDDFARRLREGPAKLAWGGQQDGSPTSGQASSAGLPTPATVPEMGRPSSAAEPSPDPALAASTGLLYPDRMRASAPDQVPRRQSIPQRIRDKRRGSLGLHLLRQPTVPEMELATGFAAKVYGELLQAKKDVHRVEETRHHLVAKYRRLSKEVQEEEKKYRCLLDTHAEPAARPRAGSISGYGGKAGSVAALRKARNRNLAKARTRSVCGTLILNETARASAYKESLAQMMHELKKVLDSIRQTKARSAYKHHEKLAETSKYLVAEVANLRRLLESKTSGAGRVATLIDTEKTRVKVEERGMIIEFLTNQIKAVQAEVRDLQLAVSTAYNKHEAQKELKDHLVSKLNEALATTRAKQEDLGTLEARLRRKLDDIEAHTRAQCTELAVLKTDGEQKVSLQREALLTKAAHAEKLKQQHSEQAATLASLMEKLARAQASLQEAEAKWAAEEATMFNANDTADRRQCAALQREWNEEKQHLQQRHEALVEDVEGVNEKLELAQKTHQDRLAGLRHAAERRQDLLLDQLRDS
eukprot:TRINITY_DN30281_c0_g1_i1.p1 TRINITY_DN30281_c0_g1~~TRINITY_DN30281_c0_g1_i1.p1  ORF type:complete len:625 (+),score=166.96 TRINITY_DN30281_c0_g1_i1:133-2007(+)